MDFKFKAEKTRLKGKIVIVINGKGGVGKDTICDAVAHFFNVKHISAITPIKNIARECGWNGEKDDKSRKLLSDLKQVLIGYNNYPTNCLLNELSKFIQDEDNDILFIDIREPDEIRKFTGLAKMDHPELHVTSLLVTSRRGEVNRTFGNKSDDDVEKYDYGYIFENNGNVELLEEKVWHFFVNLFQEEGLMDSRMPFVKIVDE